MNIFIKSAACAMSIMGILFCIEAEARHGKKAYRQETVLKIASFNVGHFNQGQLGGYQGDDTAEAVSAWRSWMGGNKCDVLFLQEWNRYFDKDSLLTARNEILDPFYENTVWGTKTPGYTTGYAAT